MALDSKPTAKGAYSPDTQLRSAHSLNLLCLMPTGIKPHLFFAQNCRGIKLTHAWKTTHCDIIPYIAKGPHYRAYSSNAFIVYFTALSPLNMDERFEAHCSGCEPCVWGRESSDWMWIDPTDIQPTQGPIQPPITPDFIPSTYFPRFNPQRMRARFPMKPNTKSSDTSFPTITYIPISKCVAT